MIELAKLVDSRYIPPRIGVIVDAYDSIKANSELNLCSSSGSSWNYILDFLQIRNVCVHNDGVAYEQRHIDAVRRLRQFLETTEQRDGSLEICLTRKSLFWILDKMTYFYGLLIDELEKYENKKEEQ